MPAHIIDSFVTIFRLNLDDFKAGVKEADAQSKRLKDSQKKTFDQIEESGKRTGEAIKGVTREVIGLGLAFMGARSIVGFAANLASGAASADRFGQKLGMSIKQVWAWRQAMTAFGGSAGDADSSIQAIQNARIAFQTGSMDSGQQAAFGRLGITGNDLRNSDAGSILSKLAGSKLAGSNPQLYSALLSQIGLSSPMVSMLMQGQSAVERLIGEYQANSEGLEQNARDTEALQKEMAALTVEYQKALVPILKLLLAPLQTIAGFLGKMVDTPDEAQDTVTGAGIGGIAGAIIGGIFGGPLGIGPGAALGGVVGGIDGWGIGSILRGKAGNILPGKEHGEVRIPFSEMGGGNRQQYIANYLAASGLKSHQVLGIMAGLHAENAGFDPNTRGGYMNRAVGIGQWLGDRRKELFRRYGEHPNLQQQLEFLMWELRGGDNAGPSVLSQGSAHGVMTSYLRDFMRPHARGDYRALMADINRGRSFIARSGGGVTIGSITVHTQAKDANGIARDMHGAVRRRMAVAQADPIVNP